MATKTEAQRLGDWLVAEFAPPNFCREEVTIVSGQNLVTGTLVGKITASSKYKVYADGDSDGSQVAAGVLIGDVDASAADKPGVILARGPAVISTSGLTSSDAAGLVDLLALSAPIVARAGV